MEWQTPQFLYLILPLSVSWLMLMLYSERRRERARSAFIAESLQSRMLPTPSAARFWIRLLLRETALVTGLVALAGPRFGTQVEQVVPRGSDLYVLMDVSRSMLADDVVPSRLERAKADVSALVNRLEGERIGLIAFAGQAVVKCPLTVDYSSFRRSLNDLDPDSAPRGGTAIGDAIRKAIEVFHSATERDQAVLLITDGGDQESYPLEAAAIAAEKQVTIFTVGLGDTETGSRVPQKGDASTFVEHEGQQVWSKLDGKLLQDIALKTSGIYVPAGTRAYDLGELYATHLQGRRGNDAETQQRIRKSERYQLFLAITLLALLADLCISPCALKPRYSVTSATSAGYATRVMGLMIGAAVVGASESHVSAADQAVEHIRSGMSHYDKEEFEAAGKSFAAASEELQKEKSELAAVAAFDEACVQHRQGERDKAREAYLRAGLSPDRNLATASHFNLGTMLAEHARSLAGSNPETVPSEKRQEILDQLKQAIVSYRHCLELQPEHQPSRRNLELLRNWMKYYSDRWREQDRQQRRDDSSLMEFLEFLIQTQKALKEAVRQLPEPVSADEVAELKRTQDELAEEVPVLRDKIAAELQPQPSAGTTPPGATSAPPPPQPSKETEDAVRLLQSWADQAGKHMASASEQLQKAAFRETAAEQQSAVEELDRIWDALIPFHPLLTHELAAQTTLKQQIAPGDDAEPAQDSEPEEISGTPAPATAGSPDAEVAPDPAASPESAAVPETAVLQQAEPDSGAPTPAPAAAPVLSMTDEILQELIANQERTLRKARLLVPKAEMELQRLETSQAAQPESPDSSSTTADPSKAEPPIDPELIKAGLSKAVELAPAAVSAMESTVTHLQQRDLAAAGPKAEEARRVLEEIQQAQPKEKPKQDQQNEDQEKNGEQNQDEQNKDQEKQNKDQQKNDQDQQKSDPQNQKNDDKKDPADPSNPEKQEQQPDKSEKNQQQHQQSEQNAEQQKSQPAEDRIEEALRKVRERQQEKRERDRQVRARIRGRVPVDKDW